MCAGHTPVIIRGLSSRLAWRGTRGWLPPSGGAAGRARAASGWPWLHFHLRVAEFVAGEGGLRMSLVASPTNYKGVSEVGRSRPRRTSLDTRPDSSGSEDDDSASLSGDKFHRSPKKTGRREEEWSKKADAISILTLEMPALAAAEPKEPGSNGKASVRRPSQTPPQPVR